jgi:uncharacterized protein with GYD domain
MKYVFMGTLSPDWIGRQTGRRAKVRDKTDELGIAIESLYYLQGEYDFIAIVEASDPYVVLGFSLWYAKQGFGRVTTMPAFDEAVMERADAFA